MKKVLLLIVALILCLNIQAQNKAKLAGEWENGENNLALTFDENGLISFGVLYDVNGNAMINLPPIVSAEVMNDSTILMELNAPNEDIANFKTEWKKNVDGDRVSYWSPDGTMVVLNDVLFFFVKYHYDPYTDVFSLLYFFGHHNPPFYDFTRKNKVNAKANQYPNYQKIIGKWISHNTGSYIMFQFYADGTIINEGDSQRTKFNSWRMKDNNTIEFEVKNGDSSFFMPWSIIKLSDNNLILGAGEAQINFVRN